MDDKQITVSIDGTGIAGTKLYDSAGVELTDVREVTIHHEVGSPPKATLTVYAFNGQFQAEVEKIEKVILPPLKMEESTQLVVGKPQKHYGRMRSRYVLTKYIPLPTYGTKAQVLAKGWMPPVGPLTIERVYK